MKVHRGIEESLKQLEKEKGKEIEEIKNKILRLRKYVDELNKVRAPSK